jgi:hypothetical protein
VLDRTDPACVSAPPDRYEPLPGLFGLPGHFLRKLSPRGRWVAAVVGVLLLAGGVAAVIVLAPHIEASKREHAAGEREARIRASKQARARFAAERRPRIGRLQLDVAAGGRTLVERIERAITRDAEARAANGELENRPRYTSCRPVGREGRRALLACTVVTSELRATGDVPGVVVGYSYRAAVSTHTGRFAFCKVSSQPLGTSSPRELRAAKVPRVCGG